MKPTKAQNPFGVQIGQVWKPKDKRYKKSFVVIKFDVKPNTGFACAVVEYGKGKTVYRSNISLTRFKEYTLIK